MTASAAHYFLLVADLRYLCRRMFALIFVFVALAAVVLPDAYLVFGPLRGHLPAWGNVVIVLSSIIILTGLACGLAGWWNDTLMRLMFGLLMCAALPKLAFVLLSAPAWGRSLWLNCAGLALSFATLAGSAYGFACGWKRLTVNRVTLTLDRLPAAFDGYRVVQISDLHVGTFGRDASFLHTLADSIARLAPDLVVFTGDLVNSRPEEIALFTEALSRIGAKDGVMSILGNHDYCLYDRHSSPDGAARAAQRLVEAERTLGWQLLRNEHRALVREGDTLYVAGVENSGRRPFPSRGDLGKALAGIPAGAATILLSHDPWHWRSEVVPDGRADLTLSGHTHAMQLKLFGFSPAQFFAREWGGLYAEGRQRLYVCTGTGGNLPFRLGAWPEIAVLELRCAKR